MQVLKHRFGALRIWCLEDDAPPQVLGCTSHLVCTPRDDDGTHAIPGERHGEGLHGDRVEVEDARVELNGAEGAAGDDHLGGG